MLAEKIATEFTIMKKAHYVRALLGTTQEEMAMFLHITRSQWSMYELGQRDLPSAAYQLLAELLVHVKENENAAKRLPHPTGDRLKLQQQKYDFLLRENQYRQLKLARKIAALEKKQAAQLKRLQIVDFVNSRHAKDAKANSKLQLNVADKVIRSLDTDDFALLMEHDLKLELLGLEKILLESKMRKILLNLENKGEK